MKKIFFISSVLLVLAIMFSSLPNTTLAYNESFPPLTPSIAYDESFPPLAPTLTAYDEPLPPMITTQYIG